MDDFNPYAAPKAQVSFGRIADEGVWQEGKILVMAKAALLPSRCVKCNEPATFQLKRSLSWHNPLLYILIFFPGLLIYVIVALIVRKTAKIMVPLCDEHRAKRSKSIMIAWICSLLGIALWFTPALGAAPQLAPILGDSPLLVFGTLFGIVLFLFGLIYGSIKSQVVTPQKIDDTHVWLKKVSPLYLAELPQLPNFATRS